MNVILIMCSNIYLIWVVGAAYCAVSLKILLKEWAIHVGYSSGSLSKIILLVLWSILDEHLLPGDITLVLWFPYNKWGTSHCSTVRLIFYIPLLIAVFQQWNPVHTLQTMALVVKWNHKDVKKIIQKLYLIGITSATTGVWSLVLNVIGSFWEGP